MLKRIFLSLLALVSIFLLPWWLYVPLILFLCLFFENYYEVLIFGLAVDLLYGNSSFINIPVFGTFFAVIALIISLNLKRVLKYY